MKNYIYDGSFEGLLTALYAVFCSREKPFGIETIENMQESFLYENKIIKTSLQTAQKMSTIIRKRISDEVFMDIFYLFLSEADNSGLMAYDYLSLGFKVGSRIKLYLSDSRVLDVEKICIKVLGECHRMLGLTRFRLLKGNVYYGAIEPDNNITILIAPHFAERMKCQDWIIHDVKRNIAAIYNKTNWAVIPFALESSPMLEEWGRDYEKLWKQYCASISIQSRQNSKLQKRNMPFRYWKHLVEMLPDLNVNSHITKDISSIRTGSGVERYPVPLK